MAIITDADFTWSSVVTLSSDEIWQARENSLFITTSPAPQADDGLELRKGDAIRLSAGAQLRYRKVGPDPVEIVREIV